LQTQHVAIIDQRGNILAPASKGGLMGTSDYLQTQLAYESNLEQRIVDLLEPMVGEGKLRAQVSAEMDFSQVEITEKNLDPDRQVITSENRSSKDSSSTDPKSNGVPGVGGNTPGRVQAVSGKLSNSSNSKKESIQYDTASSVKHTQLPVGRLKKLSIAVAVGYRLVEGKDGASTWEKRTPEEMLKFKELVSKAVGINSERGDQVAVINTKFEPPVVPVPVNIGLPVWANESIKWGSPLLLLLLLILGVVRPIINALKSQPTMVTAGGIVMDGMTEPDGASMNISGGALPAGRNSQVSGERMRLRAIDSTKDDPKRAAQIIRAWLLVED